MATTHIKRSTSASRLVNYAEKRAVKKDGLNLDIQYAKSEFKQVRDVYGNPGKTQAYASRIAFSPLEFNSQDFHDQATVLAVAKEVYAKAYPNQQVALYEHADTIRCTSMLSLARLTSKPVKRCTVIGINTAIT